MRPALAGSPGVGFNRGTKNIDVREVYYWDLRPATLGLTAAVQFGIGQAGLTQVRFALPEGVEARSVELADRTAPAAAAIRHWEVVGKDPGRQLVVSLGQPVSGNLALLIEMVPRIALTPGQWLLRLPMPLQGTTSEGFLAYRLDGMDAVPSPQNLSILSVSAEKFGETWTKIALRPPPEVTKAHSFRRAKPTALLGLAVQPIRSTAQLDLLWKVGARHAELTGQVKLTNPAADDLLVELELPPRFKLLDVGGPDVHHWHRQDRGVQVWLRQPRKQLILEVRGWVDHKPGSARFELAALGVRQVRAATTSVVVEPEAGLTLTVDRLQQLTQAGKSDSLHFASNDFSYEGTFALKPTPVAGAARAFTLVERRGAALEMTMALHVQPRPGELQVTVTGWSGDDLRLDVPAPVVRKAHSQNATQHVWTLQLPPGLPQSISLTLHGRFADRPNEPWHLPMIALDTIQLKDQWALAWWASKLRARTHARRSGRGAGHSEGRGSIFPAPAHSGTRRRRRRIARLPDQPRRPDVAAAVRGGAVAGILLAQHEAFWGGARWMHQQLKLLAFASGEGDLRADAVLTRQGGVPRAGDRRFGHGPNRGRFADSAC